MSKKDDELNDFVDEVTDGAYNLSCFEVIMKLVKQIQAWGDERIKNIVEDETHSEGQDTDGGEHL